MRSAGLFLVLGVIGSIGCREPELRPSSHSESAPGIVGLRARNSQPPDKSKLVVDGLPTSGSHGVGGPATFSGDNPTPIQKERWSEPDISVNGSYEAKGFGTVAVEGVCSFAEGDVDCWDMSGKPLPELGKRMRAAAQDQAPTMSIEIPTADIAIGSKNRLIVAKITRGPSAVPGMIEFDFAGRYRQAFGVKNLKSADSTGRTQYRLAVASEDPKTKATKARFTIREAIPGSAQVDLKIGAATTLGGVTFKVASISPGQENAPRGRGTWMVRLERSQTDSTIRMQADAGVPIFALSGGMMKRGAASVTFATMTDPAEIGTIALSGSRMTIVEITGIPMDPNR